MTKATVRVDIENLQHSVDDFSVWLDKKLNMEINDGGFGIEVNSV